MLTNKNVEKTKHDDASLIKLKKDVNENETIDNDAKALITKCFTKGLNLTLQNLMKYEFFEPKINWSVIPRVSEGIQ